MSFTLATWNINSVRLREPLVVQFLQQEAPDILCLQECKRDRLIAISTLLEIRPYQKLL